MFLRVWSIITIVLTCLLTLPYLIIGEWWGAMWYLITMPTSKIFESFLGGLSKETPIKIILVSIITASIWAVLMSLIISWVSKKSKT